MSERPPMDSFEQRLAHLARAYTQPAARPVDPLAVARTAMNAPAGRLMHLKRAWGPAGDRRLLVLLAGAGVLIILTALALAAGSPPKQIGTTRLVFVRDGDLFVSAADGTGATMIRDGETTAGGLGYLMAVWSPDMKSIAAVRDIGGPVLTPAIDLLAADGTVRWTVDAPGGTPSLSWSPDSARLAIVRYPADVSRDAAELIPAGPRLTIAAIDGVSHEITLPPDAEALTGALPELWTVPDAGVRWSPDGRWIAVAWDDPQGRGRYHMVGADGSVVPESIAAPDGQCRSSRNFIDWFPDGREMATVGEWVNASELCVEAVGPHGLADKPSRTVAATPADDPEKPHHKFTIPAVSPGGDRIAVSTFTDDFGLGRHATSLRVYVLESGQSTDLASGVEKLVLEGTAGAHVTGPIEGDPVWMGGFAWTPDGRQILYLSPEPGAGPQRWTIRAVDAAGGSSSSALVKGVRSFDLGYIH